MSGFFDAIDASASALSAERLRMNVISSNLANAQTTRTPEGGPYRRKDPIFESQPERSFASVSSEAMSSGSSMCTAPGRSSSAIRIASRIIAGMLLP